ncbi:MAG: MAPEG family protein [Geminicoccaceae bacterium]
MLFWIAAVLGLYLGQLFIPSLFRLVQPEVGLLRYVGSRDNLPLLDGVGGRSERAVRNLAESLPFFLAAAILTVALARETELGLMGAQTFFWGRLGYLGLYLAAVPWVRSLA